MNLLLMKYKKIAKKLSPELIFEIDKLGKM